MGQRLIYRRYAAHRDPYHKGHVWFDIVPRYLPWRSRCVFLGRITVDVHRQEPRVYCADTDRGWRYCKCFFLCRNSLRHMLIALQLYRCYVVWQSKLIMIFPLILWCAAGGTCATYFGVD